jgi:hypothetical protein
MGDCILPSLPAPVCFKGLADREINTTLSNFYVLFFINNLAIHGNLKLLGGLSSKTASEWGS